MENTNDNTYYQNFFERIFRKKSDNELINPMDLAKLVFDDIYVNFRGKLFTQPMNFTDVGLLQMFGQESEPVLKTNNDKSIEEIFYEYLYFIKSQTNKNYLTLALKFLVLFKECLLKAKYTLQKDGEQNNSDFDIMNKAPEYCNEFVTEFLENNDYFGVQLEADRNEFIELIQHFCNWLYMNSYTQSKLSRIA
jgi:hypothetical protein